MRLFLDTSDVDEIRKHYETGLISGVTTNPSLILKSGGDPHETLTEISRIFPDDASISAEVVADTWHEMLAQAQDYENIGKNITIKVPCTKEGLKACLVLHSKKIPVNVTLVFSVSQAILAARAHATYISPFVGRVDDQRLDGIELVDRISQVYQKHKVHWETSILAASIRTVKDVELSFLAGADVVTMPPKIFEGMYQHMLTDKGVELFNQDWKQVANTHVRGPHVGT